MPVYSADLDGGIDFQIDFFEQGFGDADGGTMTLLLNLGLHGFIRALRWSIDSSSVVLSRTSTPQPVPGFVPGSIHSYPSRACSVPATRDRDATGGGCGTGSSVSEEKGEHPK